MPILRSIVIRDGYRPLPGAWGWMHMNALRVIVCTLFLGAYFAGIYTLLVVALKADVISYAKWQR